MADGPRKLRRADVWAAHVVPLRPDDSGVFQIGDLDGLAEAAALKDQDVLCLEVIENEPLARMEIIEDVCGQKRPSVRCAGTS